MNETRAIDRFLAANINRAAARTTKKFGSQKAFICGVQEELVAMGYRRGVSASTLVELHQAGLIRLHRADLVEHMVAEDVRASEIAYLNATFHFVRVGA